jgi:hypothetical protein
MKKYLKLFIQSILIFSFISNLSTIYVLLTSPYSSILKPVTIIGFPFKYYEQFWLKSSDGPNWSWNFRNFLFDYLIVLIFVVLISYFKKNKVYR